MITRDELIDFTKWITITGAYPDFMSEHETVDEYLKSIKSSTENEKVCVFFAGMNMSNECEKYLECKDGCKYYQSKPE